MKNFIFLSLLLVSSSAFANGPWNRMFQNIKLPTQAVMEHKIWVNPAAASATKLVSAGTAATSLATTFTTFAAQPDFPRNIVITPGGTTANVGAGTAVVTGLNILGKTITENFAITSTQSTATTGVKAFASVSSVTFPATTGSAVTVSIGTGTKMGLIHCTDFAGDYVFSMFGGAYDATRGTFVASGVSTPAVESNTFAPNSAADGAHNVDLFYVQNFRCY